MFVDNPIQPCEIKMMAMDGHRTSLLINGKVGGAVTETTIRTKLGLLATAIQAASNAAVTGYQQQMSSDDGAITLDPIEGQPYRTIEDKGKLRLLPVTADKPVEISIPAPVLEIFDAAKKEALDWANVALGEFISWTVSNCVTYGKKVLVEAVQGYRDKGKLIDKNEGTIPLLPA